MKLSAIRQVRPFWILLTALIAVILYQQYAVGTVNRRLRQQLRQIASDLIEPHSQMGRFTGFGLNAERVSVLLAGSTMPSLAIGISVGCGTCLHNTSAWRRLAEHAVSQGVGVYWVVRESPEEAKRFLAENFASSVGIVISDPVHSTFEQMKLKVVPQTVVVEPSGIVSRVWPGVIDSAKEVEIRDALITKR